MYLRQLLATTGLLGLLGLGGLVASNSFSNNNAPQESLFNKNTNYSDENGYNGFVKLNDKTLIYEGRKLLVAYQDTSFAEYNWNKETRRYELITSGFPSGEKKSGIPFYYFGPKHYH